MGLSLFNIAFISHTLCGLLFLALAVLMVASWRGAREGALLLVAVVATAGWALLVAYAWGGPGLSARSLWTADAARAAAWWVFLLRLLGLVARRARDLRWVTAGVVVLWLGVVGLVWISGPQTAGPFGLGADGRLGSAGLAAMGVIGLILVTELYRRTPPARRALLNALCLGLGIMFTADFVFHAYASLDPPPAPLAWALRGTVLATAAPLIAVAAARNRQWSVEVSLSRGLVLNSAILAIAGGYVATIAVTAHRIGESAGRWGLPLQGLFVVVAATLLLVPMGSGHLRAWLKVFVSKHFFRRRYDYRREWLQLTRTLSAGPAAGLVYEQSVRGIAAIVECGGGALWMRRDSDVYVRMFAWNCPEGQTATSVPADDGLLRYMERREWVVSVEEIEKKPDLYEGQKVPLWLRDLPGASLVIPLIYADAMRGFLVLVDPRAPVQLHWEDVDILKTAARQATAFLVQFEAGEALSVARQFEAFNHMSAFVVHDLKTLITQLSLVVENARRHSGNADFMDDAITTVEHSVAKMSRLMQQLRSTQTLGDHGEADLAEIIARVLHDRDTQTPRPTSALPDTPVRVRADPDRLASVIGHVVKNAQEAADRNGRVHVRLYIDNGQAVVEVVDNGVGMEADFVRERLFRPFQSTKGVTGMGIGAYEVRQYLRAHGGDVHVRTAPGRGTTFRLFMPCLLESLPMPAKPTATVSAR